MSQVKKISNRKKYTNVIVTDNVKNHADDPFFVKKLEDAKKSLSTLTWPETLKSNAIPHFTVF